MTPPTSTSQWYKVVIPAGECGTKAAILQNDFQTLYTINGAPNGAALLMQAGELLLELLPRKSLHSGHQSNPVAVFEEGGNGCGSLVALYTFARTAMAHW